MTALLSIRALLLRDFWARPTPQGALELAWLCALLGVLDKRRAEGWQKVAEGYLEQARALEGGEG